MIKYVVSAAVALAVSTPAFAADFTGPRVEARIGWETPTVSGDGDVYKLGSAVSYGGEIGYDLKAGRNVTVGAYGSLEKSSVKDCAEGYCLGVDYNWQAGARVGLGFGRALGYVKLGYSNLKLNASVDEFSGNETKGGVGGGIGVDVNAGKRLYWGVEANYSDFGKIEGINFQRRQVAAKVGVRF
ncbi:MAG TPA: outer membrane beta-barrel protein [Sphingomicrobium sp.]|jgi:outer membrane immunogenic protein|nr:outer membrane beta-barrel protein [Sphingomicrobium sp.]